jgi:Ca2+-binding RTX toxin-like protein
MEGLEGRQLKSGSAYLDGHVLVLTGTPKRDALNVTFGPTNETLATRVNGQVTEFLRADITSIHIEAYNGDDYINVGLQYINFETWQKALRGEGPLEVIRIYGGGGNDDINGGQWMDTRIWGAEGNDVVHFGGWQKKIYGGDGDDTLVGGFGRDLIFGEAGNDVIFGYRGGDWLDGGDDNDRIYGGGGNDRCFGGAGDDAVHGDDGNDEVHGGTGVDWLYGGPGSDDFDADLGEFTDMKSGENTIS